MAPRSGLFINPPKESQESEAHFALRLMHGRLTPKDFERFTATIFYGELPAILDGLTPLSVEHLPCTTGSTFQDSAYSFTKEDAETIGLRFYSKEEIGM